jgi:hypothetical protein
MAQGFHPVECHQGVFPAVGCIGGNTGVVLDMGACWVLFGFQSEGVGNDLRRTVGQLLLK